MTPLHERSARGRGPYLRNSQQTQWNNIHALIGIRNRNLSNQVSRPTEWATVHLKHTPVTVPENTQLTRRHNSFKVFAKIFLSSCIQSMQISILFIVQYFAIFR
jgi:hypothetical protein